MDITANAVLNAYSNIGMVLSAEPYGNGHINSTLLVTTNTDKRYILQKINDGIFTNPAGLMDNIIAVTEHIQKKTAEAGGDVERCTLTVIPTDSGEILYHGYGGYWRMYLYVENTVAKDQVGCAQEFYDCGEAFGAFQASLADFDASVLFDVIPNFHNTPKRYEAFLEALENDVCGRAKLVAEEIEFVKQRREFACTLERAHESGVLPLRVTHNDTKLNNILFDAKTGKPVCVIDLDTIMAGYSVNDFGDSIRFGANTAVEDETDLSRVSLDIDLYRTYAQGFLKGCDGRLTDAEKELMPIGARMMTFECGMRFLTDYLNGDTYFRISRPDHNLDRCRCQFALLADMERKEEQMKLI